MIDDRSTDKPSVHEMDRASCDADRHETIEALVTEATSAILTTPATLNGMVGEHIRRAALAAFELGRRDVADSIVYERGRRAGLGIAAELVEAEAAKHAAEVSRLADAGEDVTPNEAGAVVGPGQPSHAFYAEEFARQCCVDLAHRVRALRDR